MALLMLLMLLLSKTKLPEMEPVIGQPLVVAALLPLSKSLLMAPVQVASALLLLQLMMMKLEGVLLLLLPKLL